MYVYREILFAISQIYMSNTLFLEVVVIKDYRWNGENWSSKDKR